MKKVTLLFILMFTICIVNGQEIPQKISYQGKLLENGEPVTGTKSITFTIGSWHETQEVTVTNDIYSVQSSKIIAILKKRFARIFLFHK